MVTRAFTVHVRGVWADVEISGHYHPGSLEYGPGEDPDVSIVSVCDELGEPVALDDALTDAITATALERDYENTCDVLEHGWRR